jgi:hypothetical protein
MCSSAFLISTTNHNNFAGDHSTAFTTEQVKSNAQTFHTDLPKDTCGDDCSLQRLGLRSDTLRIRWPNGTRFVVLAGLDPSGVRGYCLLFMIE